MDVTFQEKLPEPRTWTKTPYLLEDAFSIFYSCLSGSTHIQDYQLSKSPKRWDSKATFLFHQGSTVRRRLDHQPLEKPEKCEGFQSFLYKIFEHHLREPGNHLIRVVEQEDHFHATLCLYLRYPYREVEKTLKKISSRKPGDIVGIHALENLGKRDSHMFRFGTDHKLSKEREGTGFRKTS